MSATLAKSRLPSDRAETAASSPAVLSSLGWYPAALREFRLPWILPGIADDLADREVVEYGGGGSSATQVNGETWAFSGGTWTNVSPVVAPPPVVAPAMSYDFWNQSDVLFGGLEPCAPEPCATPNDATWQFYNNTWTNSTPIDDSPPAVVGAAMANDPIDEGVVMFGGLLEPTTSGGAVTASNSTWVFNGSTWRQIHSLYNPPARFYAGLALDQVTGADLLFGGLSVAPNGSVSGSYNDTWQYYEDEWTNVTGTIAPPAGPYFDDLAYDPASHDFVTVLRPTANYTTNSTWVFRDGNWSILPTTGPLPTPGETVLVQDSTDGYLLDAPTGDVSIGPLDTFGLTIGASGGVWSRVQSQATSFPGPRAHAGLGYDPATGDAVLFGGYNYTAMLNDTWLFLPNGTYELDNLTVAPSPRDGMGFVYDSSDQLSLLFGGGTLSGSVLDDTWSYYDGAWSPESGAGAPPGERYGCLANDPDNAGVLLFGGFNAAGTALAETYVWNASGWHALSPIRSPAARGFAACAYDPASGSVLLVGGSGSVSQFQPAGAYDSDTWAFNGRNWTELASALPGNSTLADAALLPLLPPSGPQMALLDGWNGSDVVTSTFLWNGTAWAASGPITAAPERLEGMAYGFDPTVNASLLLGGFYAIANGRPQYIDSIMAAFDDFTAAPRVTAYGGSGNYTIAYSAGIQGGGTPFHYRWLFGDGFRAENETGNHTYARPGTYTVQVDLNDGWGARLSETLSITVTGAPSIAPLDLANATVRVVVLGVPMNISYAANVSGGLAPYEYLWNFGDGATSRSGRGNQTFYFAGTYEVSLVVTDARGITADRFWNVTATPPVTECCERSSTATDWTPTVIAVGGVLALVAVIVGAVLWSRRRPPPDAAASDGAADAPDGIDQAEAATPPGSDGADASGPG